MPITPVWDNEARTILRYDFTGRWTWDEFAAAIRQGVEMRKDIPHTVHLLGNMAGSIMPPKHALIHVRNAFENAPANTGTMAIASNDRFVLAMYQIFRTVYRRIGERIVVVPTLDEARAVLTARIETAQP